MQADILLCTQYCHIILILCLSRLACLHCLTHYCSTKLIIIPWGFIFGQFVRYCFCCVGMAPSKVKRERSDKAMSTTCMCTCTMDRQTNKRSCYLVPSTFITLIDMFFSALILPNVQKLKIINFENMLTWKLHRLCISYKIKYKINEIRVRLGDISSLLYILKLFAKINSCVLGLEITDIFN